MSLVSTANGHLYTISGTCSLDGFDEMLADLARTFRDQVPQALIQSANHQVVALPATSGQLPQLHVSLLIFFTAATEPGPRHTGSGRVRSRGRGVGELNRVGRGRPSLVGLFERLTCL